MEANYAAYSQRHANRQRGGDGGEGQPSFPTVIEHPLDHHGDKHYQNRCLYAIAESKSYPHQNEAGELLKKLLPIPRIEPKPEYERRENHRQRVGIECGRDEIEGQADEKEEERRHSAARAEEPARAGGGKKHGGYRKQRIEQAGSEKVIAQPDKLHHAEPKPKQREPAEIIVKHRKVFVISFEAARFCPLDCAVEKRADIVCRRIPQRERERKLQSEHEKQKPRRDKAVMFLEERFALFYEAPK